MLPGRICLGFVRWTEVLVEPAPLRRLVSGDSVARSCRRSYVRYGGDAPRLRLTAAVGRPTSDRLSFANPCTGRFRVPDGGVVIRPFSGTDDFGRNSVTLPGRRPSDGFFGNGLLFTVRFSFDPSSTNAGGGTVTPSPDGRNP